MNKDELLLELVDGGIKEIYTDSEAYGGCETCDWGSQYINYFKVELTSGEINVEVNQMYEYELSEGYLMKLLLNNVDEIRKMTELEFYRWLEEEMRPIEERVEKFEMTTTMIPF